MTWPPVRTAMSFSISLRRSPKPGALTAATWSVPRSLLTTSVASASPSMSSAMMRSGLPICATFSSTGRRSFIDEIFFSWMRMIRVLEHGFHPLRIGDEVRREVAAVELHALDRLERRLEALGLFDGDDAVLADLLHRLGDQVADLRVVVRGDGADLGDLLLALRRDADLLQLLDDGGDGLVDAALERHRVGAGGDVLEAFAEDRLGEHRRGRGAVAGVVGGLGRDFLHHLRAHVLERIGQLDLLRDGDAVLGDRRGAELLVDDDVAALGAEGDLHRVGELIDAALQCGARIDVEMQFLG